MAVGDVITEVKGSAIDEASDIIGTLSAARAGDKITVNVMRDRQPLVLTATIKDATTSSILNTTWPSWLRELMERDRVDTDRTST